MEANDREMYKIVHTTVRMWDSLKDVTFIKLGEHELNQYTGHLQAFLSLLSILRFLLPPLQSNGTLGPKHFGSSSFDSRSIQFSSLWFFWRSPSPDWPTPPIFPTRKHILAADRSRRTEMTTKEFEFVSYVVVREPSVRASICFFLAGRGEGKENNNADHLAADILPH